MITVVSGLPRSGTSLMMKMLAAGGMPVYTDDHQDVLLETDRAEKLRFGDIEWLADCEGKAVKILEPHKNPPPEGHKYLFLWMRRAWRQIAASQVKVLNEWHPGPERDIHHEGIQELKRRTKVGKAMLKKLGPVYEYRFEDILENPVENVNRLALRLEKYGHILDAEAMAEVVLERLTSCHPEILEKKLWGLGGVNANAT